MKQNILMKACEWRIHGGRNKILRKKGKFQSLSSSP